MGITGCILAKNEEQFLPGCIQSIAPYVSEIIVVDNGSTDRTVAIAKDLGCKVVCCPDVRHDEARNVYLELASEPWILVIDADERLDANVSGIEQALSEAPANVMGYWLPRYDYCGGGKWAYIKLCRIHRNDSRIRYNDSPVHSTVMISIRTIGGTFDTINVPIHHIDVLHNKRTATKRSIRIQRLLDEIHKDSHDARSYAFLALEYIALGELEKAEEALRVAIEVDVNNIYVRSRLFLSQLYLIRGDLPSAEREVEYLYTSHPRFREEAAVVLAEVAFRQGRRSNAVQICKDTLQLNPLLPHMHINLAALLEASDPHAAIEHIRSAIQLNQYLLKPIIYKPGETPNVFQSQIGFLSCTRTIYEHMHDCLTRLGDDISAAKWEDMYAHMRQILAGESSDALFRTVPLEMDF